MTPARRRTAGVSAGTGKKRPHPDGGKLWSGRLGETAPLLEEFSTSIHIDRRLYDEDIEGSRAHAAMLRSIGLLTAAEQRALDRGLRAVRDEFAGGDFVIDPGDEDIHSAVERRLREVAGDVAGKLHTGRSRNDQVATDLRLYAKKACADLVERACTLQEVLLDRAEEHRDSVMPGYTHSQRAQVVSVAHHLLAYVEMLGRDSGRLLDARSRADELPLGSGALAGSTLPLDRDHVAATLGFARIAGNSLDAVSDRDFVAEIVFACALLMTHLSRLAEEVVLWCTAEYGFAELPDAYSTGSSLMPQKKNPDVMELTRGRSGRVIADVVAILTMLKGLPLAYNRDLQEDKTVLFDAVDIAGATLTILADVFRGIRFETSRLREAASDPALVATDLAEYLVRKGVPFRDAHGIVGRTVRRVIDEKRTLADLSPAEWRAIDSHFTADVIDLFPVERRLRVRGTAGAPAPAQVAKQIRRQRKAVAATRASAR